MSLYLNYLITSEDVRTFSFFPLKFVSHFKYIQVDGQPTSSKKKLSLLTITIER